MATSRTIQFNIIGRDNLTAAVNAAKNSLNSLRGVPKKISALQNALANSQNLQKLISDYRALQRAVQASQSARANELLKASRNAAAQSQAVKQLERMKSAYKDLLKTRKRLQGNAQLQKNGIDLARAGLRVAKQSNDIEAIRAAQAALEKQKESAARAAAEVKKINAAIKLANADLKAQKASVKDFGNAFTNASAAAQRLRDTLAQQQSQLAALRSSMNAQGLGGGVLAAHEMRLRSEIQQTIAALNRETEAFNRRNAAAQRFSQAQQDMANAYSNFQDATQTAETIMNPFKEATKVAMNFEREMSRVKALTQTRNIRAGNMEVVEEEMRTLTELAERLGATTEFTAAESAQGMQKYAMAGWTTKQIEAIMQATVDFASIAGDHNLMRTADVLSDDLTAFGLKAGQAYQLSSGKVVEASKYFTDAVSYAITQANLDREFFHESWKYNAPVAHAMNLSLGEAIAQNMVLANAGIKGSMSGTSLRQFWVRLSAPPKTAQKSLEEMGMLASDATKKIIETNAALREAGADPNSDLFDKIAALEKYYQEGKAAGRDMTGWLKQLTGQTALSGIMSLFDLGKLDEARRYKMEIDTGWVENWTADVAKITRENSATEVEYLKSAWDALANSVGQAFLPAVTAAAKALTNFVNAANNFVKNNQAAVQWLGLFAGALSGIIVAGAGIAGLAAAFNFISGGLMIAVGAARSLVTVLSAARAAVMAFGATSAIATAIAGAPIWLIVAAVAAVIGIVAYATGCFDGLGDAIANAFNHPQGAIQGFCELAKSSIDSAVNYILARWLTLKSALSHPIEAIINFVDHGDVVGGNVVNGTEQVQNIRRAQRFMPFLNNLPVHTQGGNGSGGSFGEQVQPTANSYELTANLQPVAQAAQQSGYALQNFNAPVQAASQAFQGLPAPVQQLASAMPTLPPEMQNLATSTQMTSPQVDNLGNSSAQTSPQVDSLGTSSNSAGGNVQALGGVALGACFNIAALSGAASAVAGALQGAAAQIASIHISVPQVSFFPMSIGVPQAVASNAEGGIYNRGSFLTTFAEKSPEAAVPINNSARAKNLWLETGNLLGMFDGGGSNSVTVNLTMNFAGERPQDNSWVDDVRQTFEDLANEYFANRRRVSYA